MQQTHRIRATLLATALAVGIPLFAPGGASLAYQDHADSAVTASVIRVDKQNRLIVLREANGKEVTVAAGPYVKNFDQLKVGDQVTATYQAALAVDVLPANSASVGVQTTQTGTTAAPGEKPGINASNSATITTRLTAIDLANHTVTLTGADGNPRVVEVKDPARQARMKDLKVGQMIRITYTEAAVVTVTPRAAASP
jgi:hypothetical protein